MGALLGLWGRAGVSLEPMTVMYEKYLMVSAVTDSLPCVVEAVPVLDSTRKAPPPEASAPDYSFGRLRGVELWSKRIPQARPMV